jgi:hypothetical protein
MFFANLRTRQQEETERVARFILVGGKCRFLIRASLCATIIPWLGLNLFFFTRIHSEGIGGSFLAVLEAVILLIYAPFGILIGLRMWERCEQIAKSR